MEGPAGPDLLLDWRCDYHCNQTCEPKPYRETKHHHITHHGETWHRPPVKGCRGGTSADSQPLGAKFGAFGELPVWTKTVAGLMPVAVTTRMVTTGISCAIRPYLIAIAPETIFSNPGNGCSH